MKWKFQFMVRVLGLVSLYECCQVEIDRIWSWKLVRNCRSLLRAFLIGVGNFRDIETSTHWAWLEFGLPKTSLNHFRSNWHASLVKNGLQQSPERQTTSTTQKDFEFHASPLHSSTFHVAKRGPRNHEDLVEKPL